MPKNFSRRTFDAWLKVNLNRFKFKPVIHLSRKHYFELRFSGLAPELFIHINNNGTVEVVINNKDGEYQDVVADFDLHEETTAEGMYYCQSCLERTYYPDRASLWRAHVFDDMLEWINEINNDDWICLWGYPSGPNSYGADRKERVAIKDEFYHTCFPLVVEFSNY